MLGRSRTESPAPFGQPLVTWPHPFARDAGKWNLYFEQSFHLLKIGGVIMLRKGRWVSEDNEQSQPCPYKVSTITSISQMKTLRLRGELLQSTQLLKNHQRSPLDNTTS